MTLFRSKQAKYLLPLIIVGGILACTITDSAQAAKKSTRPVIRVALAGDSTVNNKAGWGGAIGGFFTDRVKVINYAAGGRSSKSFINEGRLKKALADKPDYLFIQFGHNDCPGKGPKRYTDPKSTYMDYLKVYVKKARIAGATPILITPMTRRKFDADGKIKTILDVYSDAMKKVAAEEKVGLIDLHTASVKLFEKMGEEKSAELQPKGDRTHFNAKGTKVMARLITRGLPQADAALAKHLKGKQAKQGKR
jgi:lysophospholipase L1-like esterase